MKHKKRFRLILLFLVTIALVGFIFFAVWTEQRRRFRLAGYDKAVIP